MKKIVALLISFMMVFAFVACNNGKDPNTPGSSTTGQGGGDPSRIINDPDYNPYDPEQYIYRNVFANSTYKDQWDTSRSGAKLDGIWDSSVLPEVFPEKPDSVTAVDRTQYVGKLDNKIGSGRLGEVAFDEEDYEFFYVMFDGTEATLNSLVSSLCANLAVEDDRDTSWTGRLIGDVHAYSTEWYLWLTYSQDGDWDDNNNFVANEVFNFTLYAVPAQHQLPKLIEGVPLMQAGYLRSAPDGVEGYNEGDDEMSYIDYDYQIGAPAEPMKQNWCSDRFEYYGADLEDMTAYGAQLLAAGFTLAHDSSYEDHTSRTYTKGSITVDVQYYGDDHYVWLRVIGGNTDYFYY